MKKKRNALWYTRMGLIGGWFGTVSVGLLPVSLFRRGSTANNKLYVRTLVSLGHRILGIKVHSRISPHVNPEEPAVYIMNHQASLDIMVNSELIPDNCAVIAKRPLMFIPVFGWILALNGNVLLNKTSHKHSLQKMSEADVAIATERKSMWIFPEGTRSYQKGLGKFKKGAFYLAIKNQVPIVPVCVSSYYKNIDFTRKNSGEVIVEMLDPISTIGLTLEDVPQLLRHCETLMRETIERLDAELAQARQARGEATTGSHPEERFAAQDGASGTRTVGSRGG